MPTLRIGTRYHRSHCSRIRPDRTIHLAGRKRQHVQPHVVIPESASTKVDGVLTKARLQIRAHKHGLCDRHACRATSDTVAFALKVPIR
jgi:hypothetical protein